MSIELLTKDEKIKLKRKGILYYNSFLIFILQVIASIIYFKFISASVLEASLNMLSSESGQINIFLSIFSNIFISSSLFILFLCLSFVIIKNKLYFSGLKLKVFIFKGKKLLGVSIFKNFIFLILTLLVLSFFSIVVLLINANLRVYQGNVLLARIISWFNSNNYYWQMLTICFILLIVNFSVTYLYFNFSNKKKLN